MVILADANIYLAVLLEEVEKQGIIKQTEGNTLASPLILPYEIGNALSAMHRREKLTENQILKCYSIFEIIPVRLVDVNIKNALRIAADFDIYAYDAYYLEVAQRYKYPLLSLDQRMKTAAAELGIHLLEV